MKTYHIVRTSRDVTCAVLSEEGEYYLDPKPSQKIINHSPDGFEFGYGGVGPTTLSLAILLDLTMDESLSRQLYQSFKWDFIASSRCDTLIIEEWKIRSWIKKQHKQDHGVEKLKIK